MHFSHTITMSIGQCNSFESGESADGDEGSRQGEYESDDPLSFLIDQHVELFENEPLSNDTLPTHEVNDIENVEHIDEYKQLEDERVSVEIGPHLRSLMEYAQENRDLPIFSNVRDEDLPLFIRNLAETLPYHFTGQVRPKSGDGLVAAFNEYLQLISTNRPTEGTSSRWKKRPKGLKYKKGGTTEKSSRYNKAVSEKKVGRRKQRPNRTKHNKTSDDWIMKEAKRQNRDHDNFGGGTSGGGPIMI